ncbi:bifunctional protein-serine/threonine kinase/phosphatase [Limnobacter litoralis]|uniref:Protein kinase n=1 Tax=Limnobacter litoralis TaxID=481366 RepID=A0ABQ5YTH9_9BURK|nr:bifunctional protein-serine/threonine kinase/phosphatase [Limnobacter litoralis]GLR26751.1 protein kinase [Limnobacter litoralis]
MPAQLTVSLGQFSDAGLKPLNQDFHGALVPQQPLLTSKGIAVALADGISSSPVSQVAAETVVKTFLEDYYCTSEAWSVKTAAHKVLSAINSWLCAQTRQSGYEHNHERGYVCTFSALVFKSNTAHLLHIGDTRVYRFRGTVLEQLTEDHRVVLSRDNSVLARAMGASRHLELDYQAFPMELGDIYLLLTDGVYEPLGLAQLRAVTLQHLEDTPGLAKALVQQAKAAGSPDNLTAQVVRIESLPPETAQELQSEWMDLPLCMDWRPGALVDGLRVVRELHRSGRSQIHLAVDEVSGKQLVVKVPASELVELPGYLERFVMEEWIARRVNSPHVLKTCNLGRKRHFLYVVMEFVQGQTLAQWMIDHPRPTLESVRQIVEQIARGLQAFHRSDMLHQDLRPENILIDTTGTVKLIDFGAVRVAGLRETAAATASDEHMGSAQYLAPEYFLGLDGTVRSEVFSLGVLTYQMLAGGRLPYGAEVPRARSLAAQKKLHYESVLSEKSPIPAWVDGVLRKAVHPDPARRHHEVSEFVHELRQPSAHYLRHTAPALIERNPVAFWRGLSLLLGVIIVLLLAMNSMKP